MAQSTQAEMTAAHADATGHAHVLAQHIVECIEQASEAYEPDWSDVGTMNAARETLQRTLDTLIG